MGLSHYYRSICFSLSGIYNKFGGELKLSPLEQRHALRRLIPAFLNRSY